MFKSSELFHCCRINGTDAGCLLHVKMLPLKCRPASVPIYVMDWESIEKTSRPSPSAIHRSMSAVLSVPLPPPLNFLSAILRCLTRENPLLLSNAVFSCLYALNSSQGSNSGGRFLCRSNLGGGWVEWVDFAGKSGKMDHVCRGKR